MTDDTASSDAPTSRAEYQRQYRAKRSSGRPAHRPAEKPCGTRAAYRRHLARGEEPDEACIEANRQHQHEMYLRRKAREGQGNG